MHDILQHYFSLVGELYMHLQMNISIASHTSQPQQIKPFGHMAELPVNGLIIKPAGNLLLELETG